MSAEGRLRQLEGEVRVLLAEIGRVTGEPVKPDEYVSHLHGVEVGWTWRPADGWSLHVAAEGDCRNAIYVHSPHATFDSDVTPLWPSEARDLAAALLVAADAVDAGHLMPVLAARPRPSAARLGEPS